MKRCAVIALFMMTLTGALWAETVVPLEDFERPLGTRWSFSNGPEFPGAQGSFELSPQAAHEGRGGGRLAFDFTSGGAYVQATLSLPAEPPLEAVELWVKKPVQNRMTVRFVDQQNQTFQKSFNFASTDWQRIRVRFDTWSFSWGGPGDGQFHGSPKAFGVLVERGEATTGAVYIDQVVGIPRGQGGTMASQRAEYVVTRFGEDEGWGSWADGPRGATSRNQGTVRYDFSQGAESVNLGHDLSLLGQPQELELKLTGDASGHEVRVTLYSHFQHFERSLGRLTERGEMTLRAPLGDLKSWGHYGGEDDGVARLPLRVGRLSVVKHAKGPQQGEVAFRELLVRTAVPPDSRLFPVARVVKGPEGRPVFEVAVTNLNSKPLQATVITRLRAFDRRILAESQDAVVVPEAGGCARVIKPVPEGDLPFVEAQFTVTAPGQRPQQASASYVAPWPDPGSPDLRPASPWGMGLYLYRYSGDPQGLAAMDRAAALAQAAGVKWSREEFLWHRIEPRKGEFDWSFYDRVVDTAHHHGISIYGLIDYWSEWTQPYTEQGIEDYCRYAEALVTHYKDRIKHWEIWNEPNIFFWSGPKELYFRLLDRAYEAIKRADPDAIVFGCSTAGVDTSFIERTMQAGARFDGLTIHPYRHTLDDAAFVSELRGVSDLVAQADKRRPVWITEMGWSTQIGGISEREQAALLARCYLDSVASGGVQNVSWYDFREDGANPYYNEHHFGIVRPDLSPKPAYRAAAVVCRTIGEAKPLGFEEWSEGIFACRFGEEHGEVLAVWSLASGALLRFDNVSPDLKAVNLMGETLPVRWVDAHASVYLPPEAPVFLRLSDKAVRPTVMPLQASVTEKGQHPGEQTTVKLQLGDLGTADLAISWQAPPEWQVQEEAPNKYLVRIPADAQPGSYEIVFRVRDAQWEIFLPVSISVEPEILEV